MITQTGSSGALRGGPSAAVVPVTSVLQGGGARVRGPGLGPGPGARGSGRQPQNPILCDLLLRRGQTPMLRFTIVRPQP